MKLGKLHFAIAVLLLLVACPLSPAQRNETAPQSGASPASDQKQPAAPNESKPADATAQKPAKPMTPAEARQAELLADTERLYRLTQELKAEVAKSNKDTLSVPVVKKAEEIEKLAKVLKERMRASQ